MISCAVPRPVQMSGLNRSSLYLILTTLCSAHTLQLIGSSLVRYGFWAFQLNNIENIVHSLYWLRCQKIFWKDLDNLILQYSKQNLRA